MVSGCLVCSFGCGLRLFLSFRFVSYLTISLVCGFTISPVCGFVPSRGDLGRGMVSLHLFRLLIKHTDRLWHKAQPILVSHSPIVLLPELRTPRTQRTRSDVPQLSRHPEKYDSRPTGIFDLDPSGLLCILQMRPSSIDWDCTRNLLAQRSCWDRLSLFFQ
jgi:hypothetical protein